MVLEGSRSVKAVNRLRRVRLSPDIILASLTINMLGMALPITMIQIYDRIIPNAGYQTLTVLMSGVFAAIFAEAAVRMARSALLTRSGAVFESSVYDDVLSALVERPGPNLSKYAPGELSNRLRAIDKIRSHYCSEGAASLLDIPFIGIFVLMMLMISGELGVIVVGFVCLVFAIVRLMRRKNLVLNLDREASDTRRQSFLVQSLLGIEFIKSSGIENLMERRYERLMSGSAPIGARIGAQTQMSQGITAIIGLLAPFLTTSVGAYLVIQGSMSVGGLAASVLLTGRVIQPVLRIEAYWGGRDAIKHAEVELKSILETNEIQGNELEELKSLDSIELRNISWQPDLGRPPVLSEISLKLKRGDCISIFGGEGSGKSSLLSVLAGQLTPSDGEVLINGVPIANFIPDDVSGVVSTLTRENGLLDGSLSENLTGFKGSALLPDAMELAAAIGIDRFIEKHSMGIDMRVYSGGKSGLPNAIADSVVIIGGLANSPDLILFDDANSRLDAEQDQKLLSVLGHLQPDVILVLITHRPSYLKLAKTRLDLNKGVLTTSSTQSLLDLSRYGKKCA